MWAVHLLVLHTRHKETHGTIIISTSREALADCQIRRNTMDSLAPPARAGVTIHREHLYGNSHYCHPAFMLDGYLRRLKWKR
jgi:hypothetical protein